MGQGVIRAHTLGSQVHTGTILSDFSQPESSAHTGRSHTRTQATFQGHMYTQVGVVPGSHVHTGRGGVGGVGDESVRRHSFQGHMYTQVGVGRGQVSTY